MTKITGADEISGQIPGSLLSPAFGDAMSSGQVRAAKSRQTQWTAQFLAAGELVRNGYTVTFTMGNNTPYADLCVASREGKLFWVDVKGLSSKSDWLVNPKSDRQGLFYVLVYVSKETKSRNLDRFFVLSQEEANKLEREYREARPGNKTTMRGFRFRDAETYEDKWQKLPTNAA